MNHMEKPYKEKILVVDDDVVLSDLLSDFFLEQGHEATICNHPIQALETFKKTCFDLVFIDINMPEMNGLELATRLKQINSSIEIIFMTGHGSFDNAVQAIKIGAYDYLRKPFVLNELKLCLKRFQERRELVEQANKATEHYFQLVQNIPILIVSMDKDLNLKFINKACKTILGYSVEEAISDPEWFLKRIYTKDYEHIKKNLISAFKSDTGPLTMECILTHRDGHMIHTVINSIPPAVSVKSSEIKSIEYMIMDITDRILIENETVQREKLKLLSAVSEEVVHEFRNPLTSIGGFARRIQKKFPASTEGDIILTECKRLENLIYRLTEYLKPIEVNFHEFSVKDLITDCVESIRDEFDNSGITFEVIFLASATTIVTDNDLLKRVVSGLIKNSIKEMPQGGILHIKTFEQGDKYNIEFKNTESKVKDPDSCLMPFNETNHCSDLPILFRLVKNMGGILSFRQEDGSMIFTISLQRQMVERIKI